MKFITSDAMYWYELNGNGPVVMLLHGFTGSSKTWAPFIKKWEKNFRVLTVDLPGHGKTETKTGRSMEKCCDDLKQLCDHLDIKTIHLVGYSMGGRTALSFAMIYPEMVSSLLLESASPGLDTEQDQHARIQRDEQLAKKIEAEGVDAFVNFWEKLPLFQTQTELSPQKQQTIREERIGQTKKGLAQSLRSMGTGSQPSWWGKLAVLNVPVLLLAGDQDEKFMAIHENMAKRLPHADLVVAEQAGHAIHVERPAFFDRIVNEFFT